jgi:hypothetical protein
MKMRYAAYPESTPSAVWIGLHCVARQPSVLEAMHPDIVQAITLLWGYPEMNTYFEKLWLDDGSGVPIAPEAMSELMLLASVHGCLSPQRPARNMASIYDVSHAHSRPADIWADVPRRR